MQYEPFFLDGWLQEYGRRPSTNLVLSTGPRWNLRESRDLPPRRWLHPLQFCFRFRFNLRLI